jgi:hypothetical protein
MQGYWTDKRRTLATGALVLLSVVLGAASIYTGMRGWGELHPFFHWKLYSQPLGWAATYTEYRVYYRPHAQAALLRLPIHETRTFNLDQYVYTLNDCVGDYQKHPEEPRNRERLRAFAQHTAPAAVEWRIVAETYNPYRIVTEPEAYDTQTVVRFVR